MKKQLAKFNKKNNVIYLNKLSRERIFDIAFFKNIVTGVLSGIISGIIAGSIVGFYLYNYQDSVEDRQFQREIGRNISSCFEILKYKIIDFQTFEIGNIASPPERLLTFGESTKNYPLSYWFDNSNKYKTELRKILLFQKKYLTFVNTCREIDAKVNYLIRRYNSKDKIVRFNDTMIYKYFVGKLYNLSDADINPYLEFGGVSSWVKKGYSELNRNPEIKELIKKYISSKEELNEMLDDIQVLITN